MLPITNNIILFLNLGGSEVMLILFVVLLFFGSKSIPELARGLGKGLREIREASESIRSEIEHAANAPEKPETPKEEEIQQEPSMEQQEDKKLPLDQQF
ncbi:MAG: twin-arginine translocase TatA/TatE family subunit [Bacteroidota bacterium]|jgi:sec-independent protein translocase protein TatA